MNDEVWDVLVEELRQTLDDYETWLADALGVEPDEECAACVEELRDLCQDLLDAMALRGVSPLKEKFSDR